MAGFTGEPKLKKGQKANLLPLTEEDLSCVCCGVKDPSAKALSRVAWWTPDTDPPSSMIWTMCSDDFGDFIKMMDVFTQRKKDK